MAGATGGRTPLLWAAAALAAVTGALHLYFAFAFFTAEPGLQVVFLGIGVVYLAGAALGLAGWRPDLVLKAAAGWVVLLIVTWGLGAAYGRTVNLEPLALADKAVEVALLVVLLLLIRARKAAAPARVPPSGAT
ncbi:MAG TPA: hypothetical protein VGB42_01085 [Candidatus Thermoplasmatota archaeon]